MTTLEYRAKAYHCHPASRGAGTILVSGMTTHGEADHILTGFLSLEHVTGGHLEKHVQGIGWTMADDDEEEIERRRLDDDALYPRGDVH